MKTIILLVVCSLMAICLIVAVAPVKQRISNIALLIFISATFVLVTVSST